MIKIIILLTMANKSFMIRVSNEAEMIHMEYSLMVTSDGLNKLDKAGIEWTYWDVEEMLSGGASSQFEIIFETEEDRNKASKLIYSKQTK